MATNTAGSVGRQLQQHTTHFFRKNFVFSDTTAVAQTLGVLPPGAIIVNAGVVVTTAFNHGTNNLLDIGTSSDDDGLATNLSLATVGNIVWDELATSNDLYSTSAVTLTFTPDMTGTAGTTGAAEVYVEFIPDNDR